jgi:hypothetical protein
MIYTVNKYNGLRFTPDILLTIALRIKNGNDKLFVLRDISNWNRTPILSSMKDMNEVLLLPKNKDNCFEVVLTEDDWIKKELILNNVDFGLGLGKVEITVYKDKLPEQI